MGLTRLCSGRKRESLVWQWFEFDAKSDKSVCKVSSANNKVCGFKLSGKNPTNLKVFHNCLIYLHNKQ